MDMEFEWMTREEKLRVVAYWWDQQGGKCCICGSEMEPYHRDAGRNPNAASIEHLVPRRENGPNKAGNVRLAHRSCNNEEGALWAENNHRASLGFPPIGKYDMRHRRKVKTIKKAEMPPVFTKQSWYPKESAYYNLWMKWKDEQAAKKARGVAWCALNALSLPRGATLLPEYKDTVEKQLKSRVARRMTAEETARWLAEKGIRGA